MALKTLVKVSQINNLSDARYCAGMGVEMIGFCLDESHPRFIELARLREISVWVAGVKVVGEFAGENVENMNYLAEQLPLDYIQLDHPISEELIRKLKKPVIMKLNFEPENKQDILRDLEKYSPYVKYFLLQSTHYDSVKSFEKVLQDWSEKYPLILGFGINKDELSNVLGKVNPKGIEMLGGTEIKPGLKNFDELSEILEALETE